MKNNIEMYNSRLDARFTVSIIYRKHENYSTMKQLFKQYGIAILDMLHQIIFIDGEAIRGLTKDHLYYIEAHEIAHYRLNHKVPMTKEKETEADLGALVLCRHNQLITAYNIGISEFYYRNNVTYKTYNKLYGSDITKRLKLAETMI